MSRKALLIGLERYKVLPKLSGVIEETEKVAVLLSKHHDDMLNYRCKLLLDDGEPVYRGKLRNELIKFFKDDGGDEALLYFNGHGAIRGDSSFLCTTEGTMSDPGISFFELQAMALKSKVKELVIIIDCCFSGGVFQLFSSNSQQTNLRKGMAILSAARADEKAAMFDGKSVFTQALIEGLGGQAANIEGDITVGSLYRYLDQILAPAEQRPQFAAYLNEGIHLRKTEPSIPIETIRKLAVLFADQDYYELAPENEPSEGHGIEEKEEEFDILQDFVKVGFVKPKGEKHMYYAAIRSKKCELTPMGIFYRELVRNQII